MNDRQKIEDLLRRTYATVVDLPDSEVTAPSSPDDAVGGNVVDLGPEGPARSAPRRPRVLVTVAVLAAAIIAVGAVLIGTRSAPVNGKSAAQRPPAKVHPGGTSGDSSAVNGPDENSTCAPATEASGSGGPAGALESLTTQVAGGTLNGEAWSLWSANGQSGANGIENGGLVIGGREYGLCPGYPNPAELQLIDDGGQAVVAGVVGYPGLADVALSKGTVGTFEVGAALPSPSVQVVNGVSFFIGTLPDSPCSYGSLEMNTTSPAVSSSPAVSAEHNLGFGSCVDNQIVPITQSQGWWQLPPGHFPVNFATGDSTTNSRSNAGSFEDDNSTCSPTTDPSSSGGSAAGLQSSDTQVAGGTLNGEAWSLWSAAGQSGANGMENGGLVLGGHEYGLCPGYPNPAELQLIDDGGQAVVAGVVGYPGLATVSLSQSTVGTFDEGSSLPSPSVQVVDGVSFFIGTLPDSPCSYGSLEMNTTSPAVSSSPAVSAEHNLGFGSCLDNQIVPITQSQGQWDLPAGQFATSFQNN
jgi:hypothetical protein